MELHEGHRARMYDKLYSAPNSLEDHEVLEILLFSVLPRVNTNPIAHELLDRFGSLDAVLSATENELMRVEGVGKKAAQFLITLGVLQKRLSEKRGSMPRVFNAEQFRDFVAKKYDSLKKEVFDIYFLDKANCILGTHRIESNLADRVDIDGKELMEAFTSFKNAKATILVHNHTFGSPEPSVEDDMLTKRCVALCRICGMKVCDHFIYSDSWIYSYFSANRLERFTKLPMNELLV